MDKQQIQALVNKGAITHVGVAADLEKLSNKEVCEKFITKHEVAAEVIAAEPKDPVGEPEPHAGEPAPRRQLKALPRLRNPKPRWLMRQRPRKPRPRHPWLTPLRINKSFQNNFQRPTKFPVGLCYILSKTIVHQRKSE